VSRHVNKQDEDKVQRSAQRNLVIHIPDTAGLAAAAPLWAAPLSRLTPGLVDVAQRNLMRCSLVAFFPQFADEFRYLERVFGFEIPGDDLEAKQVNDREEGR